MPAASNNSPERCSRQPIVCYVTDRNSLGAADSSAALAEVADRIRIAIDSGADWVQVREKNLPSRDLLALTVGAVALERSISGVSRTIVNDRLDVAVMAGAAGVHLGRESLPAGEVVQWCREGNAAREFSIGVSCHSLEEARKAEQAGASYIFFGPIFHTPSKLQFGAPQGLKLLTEMCRSVAIPTIAIGGMDEGNGLECLRSGAAGIAAIRLFQSTRKAGELRGIVARLHAAR